MFNDTSSEAGPSSSSRRPTPIRSLRQPALLQIATRDDAGGLTPPAQSDVVALKLAMRRKVEFRRKGERWMDRFCEGTVKGDEFKRGARYLEHHQYTETLHERHLNSLCSYPLCGNPPSAPYSSKQRWSISTTRRAITEKQGNAEDGFCAKLCRARSEWVGGQLEEGAPLRGSEWKIELMEELRPEAVGTVANGRSKSATRDGGAAGTSRVASSSGSSSTPSSAKSHSAGGAAAITSDALVTEGAGNNYPIPDGGARGSPQSNDRQANKASESRRPDALTASNRKPPRPEAARPTASEVQNLIANLVILEHPTPASPSINQSANGDRQIGQTTIGERTIASPTTSSASQVKIAPGRPPGSSLISTPTKLASTLISASRDLNPGPQLDEDSDAESELSAWEVEMDGFGLGEEEMALFEQMREARELLDKGDIA